VAADAFRIIYKGPVSSVNEIQMPKDFILYQNFPNPFNPSTTIRFELKKRSKVLLRIIDPLGKLVTVLLNNEMEAGTHNVMFNTSKFPSLSSGVYYFILTTGNTSESKGMVLIK
jgi:Secretion system C-terminal sorting domain